MDELQILCAIADVLVTNIGTGTLSFFPFSFGENHQLSDSIMPSLFDLVSSSNFASAAAAADSAAVGRC